MEGLLQMTAPDYRGAADIARKGLGGLWYKLLEDELNPEQKRARPASLALAKAIWQLGSKLVITTNYDKVLHWTCPNQGDLVSWNIAAPADQVRLLRGELSKPTIWYLHGTIQDSGRLVLTPDGYSTLYPTATNA